MTIEDCLQRNASTIPDKVAVKCSGQSLTYKELWNGIRSKAASASEVQRQIVPFRATRDIDFLLNYFSVHLNGGAAAPLDADCPDEKYRAVCQSFAGVAIPEGCADVLFTTGTTGAPKGVMVGHRAIIANAENLVESQGYNANLTFPVAGPLNHLGSLSKLYPVILTGGTLVLLPDGMKDMQAFFRAIDEAEQTVGLFLVPSQIRMLIRLWGEDLAARRHKIELLETGAAPIALCDMQELCRLLPDSRLFNTYASTETGIIATYDYNDGACIAGCVGPALRHAQIEITSEGRIACKGETLMMGYAGEPELTRRVLKDGRLYTADRGSFDEQGRLRLLGREDDIINIGGYKVSPTEVEDAAKSLPEIQDCVCITADHPVRGKSLKLLIVTNKAEQLSPQQIARYLTGKLEKHKIPAIYEVADKIERTFNGKINRKFYR